jgi:hypothetical protein
MDPRPTDDSVYSSNELTGSHDHIRPSWAAVLQTCAIDCCNVRGLRSAPLPTIGSQFGSLRSAMPSMAASGEARRIVCSLAQIMSSVSKKGV